MSKGTNAASFNVVRCTAGPHTHYLDMNWIRSIERANQVAAQRGAAGQVGVLRRAAGDVPVVSLAERLGAEADEIGALQHVIVLDAADQPVALLVDAVGQVTRAGADFLRPLPAMFDCSRLPFGGVGIQDDAMHLLLEPGALLDVAPRSQYAAPTPVRPPALPPHEGQGDRRLVLFAAPSTSPRERPLVFGLSIIQVVEIIGVPAVLPMPGTPGAVRGLIRWRDWPVPLIDLGARLGMAATGSMQTARVVIVRANAAAEPFGLLVRPVMRLLQLPVPHLKSERPLPVQRALTRGIVELRDETMIIPDLDQVGNWAV